MDFKNYLIDGKEYDLSKVIEALHDGQEDNAKFAFELITGKSGEDRDQYFEGLKASAAQAIKNFQNYKIGEAFYNVEPVLELLLTGDALGAYTSLTLLGVSEADAKNAVQELMRDVDAYREQKQATEEQLAIEVVRERTVNTDWVAPPECPNCGAVLEWQPVGQNKGGFSGTKAVVGGLVLGPLGLAAGALGKKQTVFQCSKCGHTGDYSKGSQALKSITDKVKSL